MPHQLSGLDHVQVAMPAGQEEAARRFYAGLLGLLEVTKPPSLAKRGGAWFQGPNFQVHLGVEADFRPAKKAHPCFKVRDLNALESVLVEALVPVQWDREIPGVRRFYAADPFGNRLEFQAE